MRSRRVGGGSDQQPQIVVQGTVTTASALTDLVVARAALIVEARLAPIASPAAP